MSPNGTLMESRPVGELVVHLGGRVVEFSTIIEAHLNCTRPL